MLKDAHSLFSHTHNTHTLSHTLEYTHTCIQARYMHIATAKIPCVIIRTVLRMVRSADHQWTGSLLAEFITDKV